MTTTSVMTGRDHHPTAWYAEMNAAEKRTFWACLGGWMLDAGRDAELNPVENIWQFLRQNHLSNRVFDSHDAILDACCDAWNALTAEPSRIRSIATRAWAAVTP